jgi:hypothetical protein
MSAAALHNTGLITPHPVPLPQGEGTIIAAVERASLLP